MPVWLQIRVGRTNIVDYMRYFLDLDPEGEVLKLDNGHEDAEVKFLSKFLVLSTASSICYVDATHWGEQKVTRFLSFLRVPC